MSKQSPLIPKSFPHLPLINGLRLTVAATGSRYKGRNDLLLITLCDTATVAGVFTQSDTAAAPVQWTRDRIAKGPVSAILTNAGNANAFTGQHGFKTASETAGGLAKALNTSPNSILLASTGVIGEILDPKILSTHFPKLIAGDDNSWEQAANAILTTDTFPKGARAKCEIDGTSVTICGIAKGSGMIAPNMATMLAFIATDAALPAHLLKQILVSCNEHSFNAITVDSDTSTNDSVFLIATGCAKNSQISSPADPRLASFCKALASVTDNLAKQIVCDGEGASKLITINVSGATSDNQARKIGLSIANSPLVKTAIFGEDANWGRIVMAIGKLSSGVDQNKISINIGGFPVADQGMRVANYDEAPIAAHLQTSSIDISISVGHESGTAQVYTCDLTHGYISINADYRS